jgi:hypothetical protein
VDDPKTAFPASKDTPGQKESRTAYQILRDRLREYRWADTYLELRADGWDWRKAVYIAWASMPTQWRVPETQQELATQVLGLKSSHTISKWKRKFPEIEDAIVEQQARPLMEYRADAFHALGQVARMVDPRASSDRKLYFRMTGDFDPKQTMTVRGEKDEPIEVAFDLSGLPVDVIRALADEED